MRTLLSSFCQLRLEVILRYPSLSFYTISFSFWTVFILTSNVTETTILSTSK